MKPAARYSAGRALEYRVRDILVASGYLVFRSAGSHSVADLIALPRVHVMPSVALSATLLVQAKRGGVLPPGEWNDLVTAAHSVSAVPVMARYTPRKPIEFFRLTALKVARGRQPMEQITFDPTLTDEEKDVIIG